MRPPSPADLLRFAVRLLVVVVLATAGTLLGACGGESDEQKAQTAVCDARDDISQQVDRLASLTLSTVTADEVKGSLTAIQNDLTTIADNRSELSSDRRDEVETATGRFTSTLQGIASDLGRSLSLSEARTQLTAAFDQLADAYRSTLGEISCD